MLNIKNALAGKSEVLPVRIPAEHKHMLDEIARRFGKDRNFIVKQFIIDGIKRINTDNIVDNSKMEDLLSKNLSKIENRLASLLSKMALTNYEIRGMEEELLKLIVGQIYEKDAVDDAIDEITEKVNTAAVVRMLNKKNKKTSKLEKEV